MAKLTLETGRTFVVKFRYTAVPKYKREKDKYGRLVETRWSEHATIATIWEYVPEAQGQKVLSLMKFTGMAFCSYKDRYSKVYGKRLALERAVEAMALRGMLNMSEAGKLMQRAL